MDLEVVDAHHHIWDLECNDHPWLTSELVAPIYGDYTPLRRTYSAADFRTDAVSIKLIATVAIEAGHDPQDPVRETSWLESVADSQDIVARAIVGFADFRQSEVETVLAAHAALPHVRGVRQSLCGRYDPWKPVPNDPLEDQDWCKRIGLLARYGLSFELLLYYQQMKRATDLCRAHPGVEFILNHSGMPARRDAEGLQGWRAGIRELAKCANVSAKLSGFGMLDRNWTAATIQAFIDELVNAFGPNRCMFGSNYPVDKLMRNYADVWHGYSVCTAKYTREERKALFSESALKHYRIAN